MCGGRDKATKEAQAAEERRRREIAETTSAIERAFGDPSRAAQLDEFVEALRGQFRTEAEQQKETVGRRAKFGLARSGLTGGSAAADIQTELGRGFQSGILKGERLSQEALAGLREADVRAKQDLLALAQTGLGATTAATQAGQALRANLAGARSRVAPESLGDIFSDIESTLVTAEQAAQRRRGLRESEIFADPFSRG